jgi:serine/threonine-protein kinase
MGYLTVDAEPWATVTVNGKVVGETPIAHIPVPAGTADVRLTNPETDKSTERRVEVSPGKVSYVRAELR